MPIDSILVSAAVVAMFAVFAGALIWGNYKTKPAQPSLNAANSAKRRSF